MTAAVSVALVTGAGAGLGAALALALLTGVALLAGAILALPPVLWQHREIADETLSPDDLKEDLIHSLQKHVEVDEPEQEPSSMLANTGTAGKGDEEDELPETLTFDQMSEEELLAGIEGLVPPEKSDDY